MFTKVLIANRGAIACRILRTLKKMGVASVAIYSQADQDSLHVREADEAYCVGEGPAATSYLDVARILEVVRESGAQAIHPGYGFLSENADFAERCEYSQVAFIGPTPQQMREFGLKHASREIAIREGVPLLPGSGLLRNADEAAREAARIGFPVMLKSTAGGGGIGMRLVHSESALREAYENVARLAQANFSDAGLYLERFVMRARHIEVQVFGDGRGDVVALGERDCSVQRRHQKVIEETPAPNFSQEQRAQLLDAALRLTRAVKYRSAGTVEFVLDDDSGEFYFLEVNTRLQVEHGVTEEVTGVDLVEWMIRQAAGELGTLQTVAPRGHSMQVRLYAEDPGKDFQPCAGTLTAAHFSQNARIETWVERGSVVPPFYDPMIAKVIVRAENRAAAVLALQRALDETQLAGIETNLEYLRQIVRDETFLQGRQTTAYLNTLPYQSRGIEVLDGGVQTTLQDFPGRLGYWNVGVPPSGPMDSLALRIANQLVGNEAGAAALECAMAGPTLRFRGEATIALAGADMNALLDDAPLSMWRAHRVAAGSTLELGAIEGAGARTYLAISGGFDVPEYLGSRATFTLGNFGGHAGRALRSGDVLPVGKENPQNELRVLATENIPRYSHEWQIGVIYGPHGAPDFFTPGDIETFFAAQWEVHYNSSRTGVRLIGPKPHWAREDGGEAGLHPSNIHDNAYAIGAVDFTGDMPVILGPDGPSLGGFVCPVVIAQAELWKMGQLRSGDAIRFVPISAEEANALLVAQDETLQEAALPAPVAPARAVLETRENADASTRVVYRAAGDAYLLVEYGPEILDLDLRFRAHLLMTHLETQKVRGIIDLTPGIRSLQVHFDPRVLARETLLRILRAAEAQLPKTRDVEVPTRIVHLPLSWDDPATQLATQKYMQSVRADAPWCPDNIEFIRRINGLQSVEDVKRIVYDARYLVLGLGDVYLGAPVATPVDPRHRLVTTKYNPARTWTPENAVGIGGAYLCIYGMEGPGGYQFVGRTLPVWNTHRSTRDFEEGTPWLLRFFDQIRFYEVEADELLAMRADFRAGRFALQIEHERFRLRDYHEFLRENAVEISAFKSNQQNAFEAERERWRESGQAEYISDVEAPAPVEDELEVPAGARLIKAPTSGVVWKTPAQIGDKVSKNDVLIVLEAMKTEFSLVAPCDGTLLHLSCSEGQQITVGQRLAVVQPPEETDD